MSDEKKSASKTRNWATILYPESCAPDWEGVVGSWKIPALASPVHDSDVNKDGSPKKPHVHLMMMFPGAKTRSCVQKLLAPLGAVGCEAVQSVRGYARYLCHMDDSDKAQYKPDEVKAFGGVKYEDLIKIQGKEGVVDTMCAIMEWCDEHRCYSFANLMRYARKERREWLDVLLSSRHSVIYRYLRSCEWEAERAFRESVPAGHGGAREKVLAMAETIRRVENADLPQRLEEIRAQGLALHADGQTEVRSMADAVPRTETPWDKLPNG